MRNWIGISWECRQWYCGWKKSESPVDRWFIPLFVGFQPSARWCRTSQPSTVYPNILCHIFPWHYVQFQYSWQYTQCHTRNFSSHAASVLHAAATLLHIAEGVLLREARHCRRWRDVVSQLRVLAMLGLAWTISWWNFQIIKLTFAMLHHPHGFIVSTTSHKYMVKTWGMVDPILFYHNFLWLYIHSGKLT